MPGSNDYSMAPELRADYTATEAQPTLIAKPKATSATLPQIYVTQAYNPETFDQAAFDAAYLKDKHGTDASKRDIRRFNNKFKTSEEYTTALAKAKQEAKAAFDAAERQKWSDSYKAYSEAVAALHKAKVGTSTLELKEDIAKLDMNPKLKPKWSATKASVDSGATTYKVQAGNTLGQIVADYNKKNGTALKWQDVAKWSGIADPSKMRIGHVINFADPTLAPAATPAQPATPPTPVAPLNPVVTPADTVAVTTPRDTVKAAAVDTSKVSLPIDTARAVVADTSRVAPVDTTKVAPVDTAKTAAVDTARVAPIDTARVAPADTAKTVAVDSTKAVSSQPDTLRIGAPQDTTSTAGQSYADRKLEVLDVLLGDYLDSYWKPLGFYADDLQRHLGGENISRFRDSLGRYYTRYDPDGRGDFYIDELGRVYNVKLGGGVGSQVYGSSNFKNSTRAKNYEALAKALHDEYNRRFDNFYKSHDEVVSKILQFNKRGGTMNRINYFQQGGAAPQQQDLQQQIIALVQAAMQGDQKATETVNKIMEAAKAGDQLAVQLAQMIQQVVEQMKGQAIAAKWGAKLGYIKSLKYAKGGKACPACEKGKQIEMKACGGKKAKKAKKRYFGGLI